MSCAVYPGTFDPMTIGHLDIAKRAAKLFDEVYVLILGHDAKQTLFTLEERRLLCEQALCSIPNIKVCAYTGLTLDFARSVHADALIRGVRQIKDYEYEWNQAMCNARIDPDIETVFLLARAEFAFISSSAVKDFARYHQKLDGLVSVEVAQALERKYRD